MVTGDSARLEIRTLSKSFGPTRVLDDVRMSVRPGEVHGLAGQNGSGKSTLIKVLTGVYTPDPGAQYFVDGRPMHLPVRWAEVRKRGVAVVHQDLGLLDPMTVAENVCVGGFPTRLGRIDRAARDRLTERTLARLGVHLEPTRRVETLTAAERAEVAIARALRDHAEGAGVIILDESTRALAGDDLTGVHRMLRKLVEQGGSAVLISHSLSELLAVTDRLTILRDGRVAGAGLPTSSLTEHEVARHMLGSALEAVDSRPAPRAEPERPVVTVRDVGGRRLSGVSFGLSHGEVLGITGLPGSGYEELPYLLTGAQRAVTGEIRTPRGVARLRRSGVVGCMRAGVMLVPERRDRDGLAFDISVRDNISLPCLRTHGRPWYVARRWQRHVALHAMTVLGIQPRNHALAVRQLSGGNQQKVLLAKWLGTGPALLVLHEPTQAVDVRSRQEILRALRRAADSGMTILVVSSEADDLVEVCDRVLICRGGGLVPADHSSTDALLAQIYTAQPTVGSPA